MFERFVGSTEVILKAADSLPTFPDKVNWAEFRKATEQEATELNRIDQNMNDHTVNSASV